MTLESRLSDFGQHTDKSYCHQYLHLYEALCEPLRARALKVLEIGVYRGGSLTMWRNYFWNAHITGVDINPAPPTLSGLDRLSVLTGDAYSDPMIGQLEELGPFDLIVDDGPHTLESQVVAAARYSSLVARGGLLLIEDIANPDWVQQIARAVPVELQQYTYAIDRRWIPGKANSPDNEIIFVLDLRYVQEDI